MKRPISRLATRLLALTLLTGFSPAIWADAGAPQWLAGEPGVGRAALPAGARWYAVVFLSPDCPLANDAIPTLNALRDEFADRGAVIVGAYVDASVSPAALQAHAREYAIRFPLVDDRSHALVRRARAIYTPQAAVFAADATLLYLGRIDDRVGDFGAERPTATHRDLRAILAALVAGQHGPFPNQKGFGCAIPDPPQ